jgi:YidC/Oxa1 family membrane protein insertase
VSQERRLIVTLLMCLAIYVGWGLIMVRTHPRATQPPTPVSEPLAAPERVPALPAPSRAPPAAPAAAPGAAEPPERIVELDSPELHLAFSSHGGTLVRALLENPQYQRRVDHHDEPVDLARGDATGGEPLQTSFTGALAAVGPEAAYDVVVDPGGKAVSFRRTQGALSVEKRFALVAPYLVQMDLSVHGVPVGQPVQLTLAYPSQQPPGSSASAGFFGFGRSVPNIATGLCRVDGNIKRSAGGRGKDGKEEQTVLPAEDRTGIVSFAGLDERFFVAAVAPQDSLIGRCRLQSHANGFVEAALELPLAAQDGSASRRFAIYLGPKDFDLLRQSSRLPGGATDADLQSTIDFGFWTALCVPMLLTMEFFHRYVGNWGIAIILLTLVIKLLLLPLQHRTLKSMEAMRKLQPQIEELKKKHGTDKERLNQEMMKLYSANNANPFSSCLPMLLQMPIWWALYRLLGTTIQLYREPLFTGWISDLTAPDPYYILPVGMGVTMIITQLLTPQTMENSQQRAMMWFMPIFFTVLMLQVPAGLTLYIFASNVLNIAQQWWLKRRMRGESGSKPNASAPQPA